MKWWIDYEVKINFKDFPWPVSNAAKGTIDVTKAKENFLGADNVFCLRPYPLHQCTDTIHLRLNNKPITSTLSRHSTQEWSTGARTSLKTPVASALTER